MGTRSRIGVMHGDKCKSVYAHWDGYLSGNGEILHKHYDSAKANHLVALGDLSSLGTVIGEKHEFSNPNAYGSAEREAWDKNFEGMTTFYARDRGEKDVDFRVSQSFEEFLDLVASSGAEYFYVMKDDVWYCGAVYPVDGMLPNTLYVLQEQLNKIAQTA